MPLNYLKKSNLIFHKPLSTFLPSIMSDFHIDRPKFVDIELSNRCNLRCRMCWFWGEHGIGERYQDRELTEEEVFNLIDGISEYNPLIYIGGSEPFIRDDLLEILKYIKEQGLRVSFATNGTLLDDKKIRTLVEIGVDKISFSIDGYEGIHDSLRGKGTFKKVTEAINKISLYKTKIASLKPIISTRTTITNALVGNLKESIESINRAANQETIIHEIEHLWFITREEIHAHMSILRRVLGCGAPDTISHFTPESFIADPVSLAHEISSVKKMPNVLFFPNLSYKQIIDYYSENKSIKKMCRASFKGVIIKPNGDVKFCPDEWISDYTLGNIRDEELMDIWNGQKALKFRSAILKHKSYPACKRCSSMYGL